MIIQNYNTLFNITLFEPQIPNNTGNIGRTCVATNCQLHLVKPMGFEITDAKLKRAGLDYWKDLSWKEYENQEEFFIDTQKVSQQLEKKHPRYIYFSAHAKKSYFDFEFQVHDYLVFGQETRGLSPEIIKKYSENTLYIPTPGNVRSLNLATSVAIVIYEGMRQLRQKS